MQRRGVRQEPVVEVVERAAPVVANPLTAEAFLTVCTEELIHEVEPWLASVAAHHPVARIYLACDYPVAHRARELAIRWRIAGRVFPLPFLAGDGRAMAAGRCGAVESLSTYWHADVIWWKIEALRWVLSTVEPGRGVLLTDCDVVFAGPVTEAFPHVDLALSPFWWWSYRQVKRRHDTHDDTLCQVDGFFNAGYLLARRPAVAAVWRQLYESGEGGFYEQKCLEKLQEHFATAYFGTRHNWGKWRKESPRPDTVSLHYHVNDRPVETAPDWMHATKARAEEAAAWAVNWMEGSGVRG